MKRFLRRIVATLVRRGAARQDASPVRRLHAGLGELTGTAEELRGTLPCGTHRVGLVVLPDGEPVDAALAFAARVAVGLEGFHAASLGLVAGRWLDDYNGDWRSGTALQADGTHAPFERPPLSDADFRASLVLEEVQVTGTGLFTLWYGCGDLFRGHGFSVTAFDGEAFTDVQVELQG